MSYVMVDASNIRTSIQEKLLNIIQDESAGEEIHRRLGEMCNDFVPMNSGELRASMEVYPDFVSWNTPYARYQYEGEVYGPNKPIIVGGIVVGWYSPTGEKHPTGRTLGTPGEYRGWIFGYTTPGTGHHWYDRAMENGGRRRFNISVTNALKRIARRYS